MTVLLARHIEDVADRLRESAAAAAAAQSLVVEGDNAGALELLAAALWPLQEAATLLKLLMIDAVRGAR